MKAHSHSTPRVGARLCLLLALWPLAACAGSRLPDEPRSLAEERVVLDARSGARGPRVLAVVAHPDDETAFAASLYKLSTHLDAVCDLLTITNGEGGFKYSTLAERLYGLELTEESVGRANLPRIRRAELLEGCRYLGLRSVHFLMQTDQRYTQDASEVLGTGATVWDLERVSAAIDAQLEREHYDFVFTLAPSAQTHGHHKAATILALRAVERLPIEARPVILCASTRAAEVGEAAPLPMLADYPETRTSGPIYHFDRNQHFGYRGQLSYQVVVNWVIAAHKSQGTIQLAMNGAAFEDFHLFALNGPGAAERAAALFHALAGEQYPAKEYGASAGATPRADG